MHIITKKMSELTPYANNARTHSPEQVARIAASITEFGWTNPVLIDETGGIIAGHGRVMAAQKMGMADVPCIVLAGLTEAQRRAYVLADNKLALDAGWDEELLRLELEGLRDLDFDLGLTGFEADELDALLAPLGIEHGGDDHSGASPWDRMNGDAKPGVLATVGEVTCRISDDAYAALLRDRPQDNVAQWLEGIIYAACGRP